MKRLTDIGFRKVGEWQVVNGAITPNPTDLSNSSNILYAFISGGEVLYVGKTVQPLKKRMYGYENPGPTQNTNVKGNRLILELLSNGKNIEIYALPDRGDHHVGVFHLNLAAGLEDSIISTLRPKWNQSGK
jgi:uncharacterized protein YfaP (DUF2135 family)